MTFMSAHTSAEVRDLLKAKDANIADLQAAADQVQTKVDLTVAAWADWYVDLVIFHQQWAGVHAVVDPDLDRSESITGNVFAVPDADWDLVLAAMPWFDDLVQRWPALPNNPLPIYPTKPTPQPQATDDDLGLIFGHFPYGLHTPLNTAEEDGQKVMNAVNDHRLASLVIFGIAVTAIAAIAGALRK